MKIFGFIVFIAALLIGLVLGSSCAVGNIGGVQGSGQLRSEVRNVSGFKEIKAGGAVNLEVAVQKDFGLTIEADDNLLEQITTEVNGDTLVISAKDRISTKNKVNIKIAMPELTEMDISGASTAVVTSVKTDSLNLEATGASKIKIEGEVKSLEANASGASGIDAENLRTENADVDSSGASSVTVSPANELKAEASGASSVLYAGEPKNIQQNASGASSIKKK